MSDTSFDTAVAALIAAAKDGFGLEEILISVSEDIKTPDHFSFDCERAIEGIEGGSFLEPY